MALEPTPRLGPIVASSRLHRAAAFVDPAVVSMPLGLVLWMGPCLGRGAIALLAAALVHVALIPFFASRRSADAVFFDGRTLFVRRPFGRQSYAVSEIVGARASDERVLGARWTNLRVELTGRRSFSVFLLEDAHSVAAAITSASQAGAA